MPKKSKRRNSKDQQRLDREATSSGTKEKDVPITRLERDVAVSGLPQYLETQRTRVFCGAESNSEVKNYNSAFTYAAHGVQSYREFIDDMDITINRVDDESMEFEIIGISPTFANALRRILISEVPTMAVEHVFFLNNTSTIPDEIIAHRLGLTPIAADPKKFKFRSGTGGTRDMLDQRNTIVFSLKVVCFKEGSTIVNKNVYSKDMVWLPNGSEMPEETNVKFSCNQKEVLRGAESISTVHEDILIAKLSPGQEIDLEAHCIKGNGAEHSKWSPVATAWYRLCPEVVLLKDVRGNLADDLVASFPADICPFEIDISEKGRVAKVKNPRACSKSLERVRVLSGEAKWKDYVQLRKLKHHFIFTIESTGAIKPKDLLLSALEILGEKAVKVVDKLEVAKAE